MGRWQALAVVAALTIATVPVLGQGMPRTPGPQMPGVSSDAEELYEEVQVLRTIRTLELSAGQMAELLAANADLLEERQRLQELREETWAEYQDEIENVLEAWMDGETPSARRKNAADRAVNLVNEARGEYQDERWEATEAVYDLLTDDQRDRVEGPGVAEARRARAVRMGGVESVGQYVLTELDALRDLMPDEFQMLAPLEAERIARAIVGPDAANLPQMTDAVLNVILDVYGWNPDRYRQQRETLPTQIADALGFTPEDERPPVSWIELMRVATSSRTPVVVEQIAPAGGGEVE